MSLIVVVLGAMHKPKRAVKGAQASEKARLTRPRTKTKGAAESVPSQ